MRMTEERNRATRSMNLCRNLVKCSSLTVGHCRPRRLYLLAVIVIYVHLIVGSATYSSAQQQQEALHSNQDQSQRQQQQASQIVDSESSSSSSPRSHQYRNESNCSARSGGAASFLLSNQRTDQLLQPETNPIDLILTNVLNRVGPDTRPTAGFRDSQDITVEVAKKAWRLMRQHALSTAGGQLEFFMPIVEQILIDSNVSNKCFRAAQRVATAARNLDSWSIQLLNSWGSFPPSGLFEGTLADIGSFHGCISVPENPQIKHAHYCTLAYRPVMPTRKDYELLIRQEPKELLELFTSNNTGTSRDSFSDLINKAQYNHYVYFKLGSCFPIDCSPFDVQKIAQLLGRSAILVSGPVKCHSRFQNDYEYTTTVDQTVEKNYDADGTAATQMNNSTSDNKNNNNNSSNRKLVVSIKDLNDGIYIWKPHITRTQKVSLIIICLLIGLILLASLVDLILTIETYLRQTIEKENRDNQKARVKSTGPTEEFITEKSYFKGDEEEDPNNNNNGGLRSVVDSIVYLELQQNSKQQQQQVSSTPVDKCSINKPKLQQPTGFLLQLIYDCSIIRNTKEFFLIGISQQKNDILCLNGLRCITMSWIIVQHTMQYNDWSAFARIYEIETHLNSLLTQPLFNGSYLVDTFFLISGLLTSFSVFKTSSTTNNNNNNTNSQQLLPRHHPSIRQLLTKFSWSNYLIGRYLRLTPQILLVSLLFICLPLLSSQGSPHWYTMTGEYSENCAKNWWINLFHIQAFYRSNEMCNFVCWWISVDMFYHLIALSVILVILRYGHKISFRLYSILILVAGLWQTSEHYQMRLPPNLLSTIPQTGLMWSQMILNYFWLPKAHSFPFLFGFYLGYTMAQRQPQFRRWFTVKRALWGWAITILSMLLVLYATWFWVIGTLDYSPVAATSFHLVTQIIWSLCLAWVICACQFQYGGFINQILSCKLFIILGKASYVVYLSHFLVLFTFFGSQNLLLEPTQILMLYVILGNVCLSMMFGSFLCVLFEMPWLKMQRRIMRKLR